MSIISAASVYLDFDCLLFLTCFTASTLPFAWSLSPLMLLKSEAIYNVWTAGVSLTAQAAFEL